MSKLGSTDWDSKPAFEVDDNGAGQWICTVRIRVGREPLEIRVGPTDDFYKCIGAGLKTLKATIGLLRATAKQQGVILKRGPIGPSRKKATP